MEKGKYYLFELVDPDSHFKLKSNEAVIESVEVNLIKDPITNKVTGSNLRLGIVIPDDGSQDVIEHFIKTNTHGG